MRRRRRRRFVSSIGRPTTAARPGAAGGPSTDPRPAAPEGDARPGVATIPSGGEPVQSSSARAPDARASARDTAATPSRGSGAPRSPERAGPAGAASQRPEQTGQPAAASVGPRSDETAQQGQPHAPSRGPDPSAPPGPSPSDSSTRVTPSGANGRSGSATPARPSTSPTGDSQTGRSGSTPESRSGQTSAPAASSSARSSSTAATATDSSGAGHRGNLRHSNPAPTPPDGRSPAAVEPERSRMRPRARDQAEATRGALDARSHRGRSPWRLRGTPASRWAPSAWSGGQAMSGTTPVPSQLLPVTASRTRASGSSART